MLSNKTVIDFYSVCIETKSANFFLGIVYSFVSLFIRQMKKLMAPTMMLWLATYNRRNRRSWCRQFRWYPYSNKKPFEGRRKQQQRAVLRRDVGYSLPAWINRHLNPNEYTFIKRTSTMPEDDCDTSFDYQNSIRFLQSFMRHWK